MMQQLELDLWGSLEAAAQVPQTADLRSLYQVLERTLEGQALTNQLAIAGNAMVQLSEVYADRAAGMIEAWERRYQPQETVIDLEDCADLFVQSLSLDVSDLFEEAEPVAYPIHRKVAERTGSIVGEVAKADLLDWIEETRVEVPPDTATVEQGILNLAHDENVQETIAAIAHYLKHRGKVSLQTLRQGLGISLIELWLGLLIGGFRLEQQDPFYQTASLLTAQNK
uniref:Uncharacterized protein n=1 Tax=Cyanothece sp. (strain PCC 7425 / ATCC 29141) TaxID=395961 RepID=B8HZL8_CYAP4